MIQKPSAKLILRRFGHKTNLVFPKTIQKENYMKNVLLIGGEGYIGNIVSQNLLNKSYKGDPWIILETQKKLSEHVIVFPHKKK